MAKLSVQVAATSQTINIFIQDSSSTTGAGLTGLVYNTASLVAYYALPKAAAVQITLATLAAITTAYSSGGFKEIDATNMPGWYRLDLPDAAIASGRFVSVHLKGATNMAPCPLEIELTGWNNQDAVRGGMTALPNANAGASSGVPILGTNSTAISFTGGMTISNASGDALALTSSGSNGNAINASGNGTGAGILATAGATGNGIKAVGGATSGSAIKAFGTAGNAIALELAGQGSAAGLSSTGGATGAGAKFIGGGTSGDGIDVSTTAGDGVAITPTAGSAIVATGNGTSKHGIISTGGTAGTSDGVKCVAGTGGVDLRAAITGNVTGNVSGSVGSISGITFPTNFNSFSIDSSGRIDIGKILGTASAGAVGYVGVDWGQVTNKTTTNALTGTTISTSQVAASVTAGVTLATAETMIIRSNTAAAGAAGSITLDASASATDNIYRGQTIKLTGGTGAGQTRIITGYTGSTQVATVDENWQTNPTSSSTFVIQSLRNPKLDSSLKIAGVVLTDTLTTYTGNTVQTGDSYVRLGAPSGASIAADLAEIEAETDLLPSFPTNFASLSIDGSGRVDVIKINGTSQTARDIGASVLLSTGTGTGQLDFTSGVVKTNVVQLLGTAWLTPGTAGTPDVNAKLIGATAQTGRDLGTSVLLSSGTGTGQLDFTSGVVKGNLVQIVADTNAPTNLKRAVLTTVLGTVTTGATTTSIPTSSLSPAASVADEFKGRIAIFGASTTTANLRGQAMPIASNTSGGVLTLSSALTDAPVSGDDFIIA